MEIQGTIETSPSNDASISRREDVKKDDKKNDAAVVILDRPPARRARFGSVRVAWHRMTLGNNPGGSGGGPPVTLGEKERSERFETIDTYHCQQYQTNCNGTEEEVVVKKKPMYRMSKIQRRDIALQNHTEDEIALVEKELVEIRQERLKSSKEPEEGSVKHLIAQNKALRMEEKKNHKNKKTGFFSRIRLRKS